MSIRLKTILGVGLIEAILLVILISSVLNYMRVTSEENLENYVATTTQLFATTTKDAILSYDLASLETFVDEILKNKSLEYVRIFDSKEQLLVAGNKPNYRPKPFIADSSYQTIDDNIFDSETFVSIDNIRYGRIEMGFSTSYIKDSLSKARELAATIAVLEMLLVALFSFFLGVYLTKQLRVLKNSARVIAAGNFDHSIHIKSHDEVGEVAHSFNKMIQSLKEAQQKSQQYHQELLELNTSLEQRVAERTEKITAQKNKLGDALEKLQLTQQQLVQSEKMASIGQLAAGVAHEINNPIAFIKSNFNTLKRYTESYREILDKQTEVQHHCKANEMELAKTKLDEVANLYEEHDIDFINEDMDTLLSETYDGIERVEEIVKGLKVYSRASDDVLEETDINTCLQDTLKMLNNELKYACTVATHFNPLPDCTCNRSKITQVFTNLIINAVHAMEDEFGTLTIETRTQEAPDGQFIVVVITDTGKGIPAENVKKLFDPFFTTKPVGQGTGLGLAISHGIITDLKGMIDVESSVGEGTSFIITLPASSSNAETKA